MKRHLSVLLLLLFFCFTRAALASSLTSDLSILLVETDVSCYGGSDGVISAIVSGGTSPYFYSWDNGHALQTNANLSAGTYAVTVTDLNGCTSSATGTIAQPDPLLSSMQGIDGLCGEAASVGVDIVGGTVPYTYVWNNGATTNLQEDVAAGWHFVTVTDWETCLIVDSVYVEKDDTQVTFELDIFPPTCAGDNDGRLELAITSGQAPFSYFINGQMTNGNFENLEAGTYVLFINDANGCSAGTTISLNAPAPIQLHSIATDMEIDVLPYDGFAPYMFEWNTGATTGQITDLSPDTYSVTVTDQNGCTASTSIDILGPLKNNHSFLMDWGIYPNPSTDFVHFQAQMQQISPLEIDLLDSHGKVLQKQTFTQNSIHQTFDVRGLPDGIYFLYIKTSEQTIIEKILVTH